jgi:hypothetical protein
MDAPSKILIGLEKKFWQSMVDQDTDSALDMLEEPALMISPQGTIKFDHVGYRKMAEQGSMVLTSFELTDVETAFPNDTTAILTYRVKQEVTGRQDGKSTVQIMNDTSTWVATPDGWKCVMHTETPVVSKAEAH